MSVHYIQEFRVLNFEEINHINNDECQVKGRTKQMHRTLAILKLKIIQTLQITDFDRLLTLIGFSLELQ